MGSRALSVHVNMTVDKVDDQSRIKRGTVVGTEAVTTDEYQNDPAFRAGIDALVDVSKELRAAMDLAVQLEAQLKKALGEVGKQRLVWDKQFKFAAGHVENVSDTNADVLRFGFLPLEKAGPFVAPPDEVKVKYNRKRGTIDIHVIFAAGARPCVIQLSQDPTFATFERLEGGSVKRNLSGYAAGTWYVRAATLHAEDNSAWVGPIPVVVV